MHQQRDVERTDVDAQLEGAGGDDRSDLARFELLDTSFFSASKTISISALEDLELIEELEVVQQLEQLEDLDLLEGIDPAELDRLAAEVTP